MSSSNWKQFFDGHAPRYMENRFTANTKAEVDFFLSIFPLSGGASILDMGCGTGRHSVELALRGFRMTGVDLSSGMLAQARAAATAAGVEVEWIEADATEFVTDRHFDAAICLCEGGFGLIGLEDDPETHDRSIVGNIAQALRPGAPFLMTALNGYSIVRQMKDEAVEQGSFDPATMVATYQDEWSLPEGQTIVQIRERLFIPPEVVRMLTEAGFEVLHVYGGTAGEWSRRPLKLDEVEAMYVARRRA